MIFRLPAFAASDSGTYAATADFNVLKKLGIFDDFEITGSEDAVTRAQFAASVYRLFKFEGFGASDEGQFIDVGSGHFASKAVNTLYSLGYVSGVSREFFAPDSAITVNEAVKILVSALGYSDYAEVKGGYPVGYLAAARKLDIITSAQSDGKLSGALLTELLVNTLRACPLGVASISDDKIIYDGKNGDSLGNINFDLYEGEGFVSAVSPAVLYEASNGEKDMITVDNTEYYADGFEVLDVLGRYVDFWYVKSDGDSCGTVLGISDSDACGVVTVRSTDISSFTGGKYKYSSENKTKTAAVDSTAQIFYNGKSIPYYEELMIPTHGSVSLVDYKGSSAYDSVIISSYVNAYVSKVDASSNTVLFENSVVYPQIATTGVVYKNALMIDGSDNSTYCKVYNAKGEEKKIASMSADQIASIYFDPCGDGASIYYSTSSVSGEIDSVYSNGDKIAVSGKDYNVFYDFISANDIFAGAIGKYMLDYLGNIAYIDSKNGELGNALFVRALYTDGLGGKPYAELVDINRQKILRLEMKSEIKLDGAKYTISDANDLQNLADMFRVNFKTGASAEFVSLGFVRYKTNSLGQISELHTISSSEYPDTRVVNAYESGLNKALVNTTLNTVGDKALYDENTVFMDIPYAAVENSGYLDNSASVVTFMNEYMMGSNAQLGLYYDLYYLDDSDIAALFVKHGKKLSEPVSGSSDGYMPQGTFTDFGMLIGMGKGLDENGETCEIIEFVGTDGTRKTHFVSSKYSSTTDTDYSLYREALEEGDIFAYYVQNGYAGNFLKVCDADGGEPMSSFLGEPYSYTNMTGTDKRQSIDEENATSGKYNTTYRVSVGRAYDINKNVLKVALGDTTDDSNLAYFNIDHDAIIVYESDNPRDDKVKKGTVADIKDIVHYGGDASKVAVYVKSGKNVVIFIYN